MRRTAAALVATVLFTLSVSAEPSVSAQSAILMDADTGRILYSCNIDRRSLIASTTKIMTAVVVLEHCDLEREYVIPQEATGIEGSSLYLKAGECLTIRDLLYGMMLHSGNDAAVALALACSDSVPEFVALMNLKAQKLELYNTHFGNPNGLDSEENYSTAADLARLTAYALENDAFVDIVSTKTITIGERALTNHNKLLWRVDGAMGVKTGYTKAAGRILVSAAERNGRRLIAVTINDGNDWQDHAALYDYGYSRYTERCPVCAGSIVAEIPMLDGTTASLAATQEVDLPLLPGEKVDFQVIYPRFAFAKGEPGQTAGIAALSLGKRTIGFQPLTWAEEEACEGATAKDHIGSRSGLPQEG